MPGDGSIDGFFTKAFPAAGTAAPLVLPKVLCGASSAMPGYCTRAVTQDTVTCDIRLSQNSRRMEEDTYKMQIFFNFCSTGVYMIPIHKCNPRPF